LLLLLHLLLLHAASVVPSGVSCQLRHL